MEQKEIIIANIKSKLNITTVTEISNSSDFIDIIDHDYALPIARDCDCDCDCDLLSDLASL